MKHKSLTFLSIILASSLSQTTFGFAPENPVVIVDPVAPQITKIEQYAFLVVDLDKTKIIPQYGDAVKLVFDKNKRTTLFNLSGKQIKYFADTNGKLIVFVPSEELRCFRNHKLKKLILNANGKRIVLKTKTPTSYFE